MDTLSGKSVCFTGDLAGMSRGRAVDLVRSHGGYFTTRVDQADILVAGQFPGSRLVLAQARGLEVLDGNKFRELVAGRP